MELVHMLRLILSEVSGIQWTLTLLEIQLW